MDPSSSRRGVKRKLSDRDMRSRAQTLCQALVEKDAEDMEKTALRKIIKSMDGQALSFKKGAVHAVAKICTIISRSPVTQQMVFSWVETDDNPSTSGRVPEVMTIGPFGGTNPKCALREKLPPGKTKYPSVRRQAVPYHPECHTATDYPTPPMIEFIAALQEHMNEYRVAILHKHEMPWVEDKGNEEDIFMGVDRERLIKTLNPMELSNCQTLVFHAGELGDTHMAINGPGVVITGITGLLTSQSVPALLFMLHQTRRLRTCIYFVGLNEYLKARKDKDTGTERIQQIISKIAEDVKLYRDAAGEARPDLIQVFLPPLGANTMNRHRLTVYSNFEDYCFRLHQALCEVLPEQNAVSQVMTIRRGIPLHDDLSPHEGSVPFALSLVSQAIGQEILFNNLAALHLHLYCELAYMSAVYGTTIDQTTQRVVQVYPRDSVDEIFSQGNRLVLAPEGQNKVVVRPNDQTICARDSSLLKQSNMRPQKAVNTYAGYRPEQCKEVPRFPVLSDYNVNLVPEPNTLAARVCDTIKVAFQSFPDMGHVNCFYKLVLKDYSKNAKYTFVTLEELFEDEIRLWPIEDKKFWSQATILWLYAMVRVFGTAVFGGGLAAIRNAQPSGKLADEMVFLLVVLSGSEGVMNVVARDVSENNAFNKTYKKIFHEMWMAVKYDEMVHGMRMPYTEFCAAIGAHPDLVNVIFSKEVEALWGSYGVAFPEMTADIIRAQRQLQHPGAAVSGGQYLHDPDFRQFISLVRINHMKTLESGEQISMLGFTEGRPNHPPAQVLDWKSNAVEMRQIPDEFEDTRILFEDNDLPFPSIYEYPGSEALVPIGVSFMGVDGVPAARTLAVADIPRRNDPTAGTPIPRKANTRCSATGVVSSRVISKDKLISLMVVKPTGTSFGGPPIPEQMDEGDYSCHATYFPAALKSEPEDDVEEYFDAVDNPSVHTITDDEDVSMMADAVSNTSLEDSTLLATGPTTSSEDQPLTVKTGLSGSEVAEPLVAARPKQNLIAHNYALLSPDELLPVNRLGNPKPSQVVDLVSDGEELGSAVSYNTPPTPVASEVPAVSGTSDTTAIEPVNQIFQDTLAAERTTVGRPEPSEPTTPVTSVVMPLPSVVDVIYNTDAVHPVNGDEEMETESGSLEQTVAAAESMEVDHPISAQSVEPVRGTQADIVNITPRVHTQVGDQSVSSDIPTPVGDSVNMSVVSTTVVDQTIPSGSSTTTEGSAIQSGLTLPSEDLPVSSSSVQEKPGVDPVLTSVVMNTILEHSYNLPAIDYQVTLRRKQLISESSGSSRAASPALSGEIQLPVGVSEETEHVSITPPPGFERTFVPLNFNDVVPNLSQLSSTSDRAREPESVDASGIADMVLSSPIGEQPPVQRALSPIPTTLPGNILADTHTLIPGVNRDKEVITIYSAASLLQAPENIFEKLVREQAQIPTVTGASSSVVDTYEVDILPEQLIEFEDFQAHQRARGGDLTHKEMCFAYIASVPLPSEAEVNQGSLDYPRHIRQRCIMRSLVNFWLNDAFGTNNPTAWDLSYYSMLAAMDNPVLPVKTIKPKSILKTVVSAPPPPKPRAPEAVQTRSVIQSGAQARPPLGMSSSQQTSTKHPSPKRAQQAIMGEASEAKKRRPRGGKAIIRKNQKKAVKHWLALLRERANRRYDSPLEALEQDQFMEIVRSIVQHSPSSVVSMSGGSSDESDGLEDINSADELEQLDPTAVLVRPGVIVVHRDANTMQMSALDAALLVQAVKDYEVAIEVHSEDPVGTVQEQARVVVRVMLGANVKKQQQTTRKNTQLVTKETIACRKAGAFANQLIMRLHIGQRVVSWNARCEACLINKQWLLCTTCEVHKFICFLCDTVCHGDRRNHNRYEIRERKGRRRSREVMQRPRHTNARDYHPDTLCDYCKQRCPVVVCLNTACRLSKTSDLCIMCYYILHFCRQYHAVVDHWLFYTYVMEVLLMSPLRQEVSRDALTLLWNGTAAKNKYTARMTLRESNEGFWLDPLGEWVQANPKPGNTVVTNCVVPDESRKSRGTLVRGKMVPLDISDTTSLILAVPSLKTGTFAADLLGIGKDTASGFYHGMVFFPTKNAALNDDSQNRKLLVFKRGQRPADRSLSTYEELPVVPPTECPILRPGMCPLSYILELNDAVQDHDRLVRAREDEEGTTVYRNDDADNADADETTSVRSQEDELPTRPISGAEASVQSIIRQSVPQSVRTKLPILSQPLQPIQANVVVEDVTKIQLREVACYSVDGNTYLYYPAWLAAWLESTPKLNTAYCTLCSKKIRDVAVDEPGFPRRMIQACNNANCPGMNNEGVGNFIIYTSEKAHLPSLSADICDKNKHSDSNFAMDLAMMNMFMTTESHWRIRYRPQTSHVFVATTSWNAACKRESGHEDTELHAKSFELWMRPPPADPRFNPQGWVSFVVNVTFVSEDGIKVLEKLFRLPDSMCAQGVSKRAMRHLAKLQDDPRGAKMSPAEWEVLSKTHKYRDVNKVPTILVGKQKLMVSLPNLIKKLNKDKDLGTKVGKDLLDVQTISYCEGYVHWGLSGTTVKRHQMASDPNNCAGEAFRVFSEAPQLLQNRNFYVWDLSELVFDIARIPVYPAVFVEVKTQLALMYMTYWAREILSGKHDVTREKIIEVLCKRKHLSMWKVFSSVVGAYMHKYRSELRVSSTIRDPNDASIPEHEAEVLRQCYLSQWHFRMRHRHVFDKLARMEVSIANYVKVLNDNFRKDIRVPYHMAVIVGSDGDTNVSAATNAHLEFIRNYCRCHCSHHHCPTHSGGCALTKKKNINQRNVVEVAAHGRQQADWRIQIMSESQQVIDDDLSQVLVRQERSAQIGSAKSLSSGSSGVSTIAEGDEPME